MLESSTNRRGFLTGRVLTSSEKEVTQPAIEGPYQIGNLALSVLPIEHDKKTWEKSQDLVTDAISQFPIIIPEYFPPEYRHLESDPNPFISINVSGYEYANYLFKEVERISNEQSKEVWVLDPAYTAEYGNFFRTSQLGIIFSGIGSIIYSAMQQHPLPRRAVIAQCVGVPLMFLGLSGLVDNFGIVEPNLRESFVATHLDTLGTLLPPESSALLIYPRSHWSSIKDSLDKKNPKHDLKLNAYLQLKKFPYLESIFYARNYVPDEDGWKQVRRISL